MNQERLMKVLLAPVDLGEEHVHRREAQPVRVRGAPDATKPEIKAAVELLFKAQGEVGSTSSTSAARKSASAASSGRRKTGRRPTCASRADGEINFAEGGSQ